MYPMGSITECRASSFLVSHANGHNRLSNRRVKRIAAVGRTMLILVFLFLLMDVSLAESPSMVPSEGPSLSPSVYESSDGSTVVPSQAPSALFPQDHSVNSGNDGDSNKDNDSGSGMRKSMKFATAVSILMTVVVLAAFAKAFYGGVIVIQPTRVPESNTMAGSESSSSGEWEEEEW